MDISFSSKKNEEDPSDRKIEFGKKFDPNLGEGHKKGPTLSDLAKGVAIEDIVLGNDKKDDKKKDDIPLGDVSDSSGKESVFKEYLDKFLANFKEMFSKKEVSLGSGVLEVNLVKEEIVKFFDWQKGVLLCFLVIFASLSVISLADWGISWWGNTKRRDKDVEYEKNFEKMVKEIKDSESKVDEVLVFKKQVDIANFLLQNHIYWSNFFDFLEENTLSNVYFSAFSGNVNGTYVLSATSDNFDAINIQTKKFLNNPYVRAAKVDAGQIQGANGDVEVSFNFVFELDPEVFLKKK